MSTPDTPRWLSRMNGVLGLFIGLFGAVAILGVFAKIAQYPGWEIMMAVGFIGEAAAFVVMGVLAMLGGFVRANATPSDSEAVVAAELVPAGRYDVGEAGAEEFREAMQASALAFRAQMDEMLQKHLVRDLAPALEDLARDVGHVSGQLSSLGAELVQARGAIERMRHSLSHTATGELPESAERLGAGMRELADGMSGAGVVVGRLQADLEEMNLRFRAFNHGEQPHVPGNGAHLTAPLGASRA